MTPRVLFDQLWSRGDELALLYENLVAMGIPQSRADELLRAEWVARLAALDLYVHELTATRMVAQFEGALPVSVGFAKFRVGAETLRRVAVAADASERSAAFDLDVRAQLGLTTFQMPEKIADGIRYTSNVRLWDAVAQLQNPEALGREIKDFQKSIKTTLSAMVERRNKIAHEGDLMPTLPRQPWAIDLGQLEVVRDFVSKLVYAIDRVVLDADAEITEGASGSELENDVIAESAVVAAVDNTQPALGSEFANQE